MSSPATATSALSHTALTVLIALNLAAGALLIASFSASFAFEEAVAGYYRSRSIDSAMLIPTMRIWMLLAIPFLIAIHVGLSRLLRIVATVRDGSPFVAENVVRLRTIGWSLLAAQLLQLLFGIMAAIAQAANAKVEWTFSAGGWLAVLLVFVLAGVLDQAVRIQNDLKAMI